jgi:hypothetical protein
LTSPSESVYTNSFAITIVDGCVLMTFTGSSIDEQTYAISDSALTVVVPDFY